MSEPDLVAAQLDDEDVLATVPLSGEDQLIITPTRSLLYEAEGLLSDESITEYPHDIKQIGVSRGRRKATIELSYALEGTKSLRVPKASIESVLHYLLAGVLNARSITNAGEVVRAVYLFNELTVIVTSERVVTNVGTSVWDEDHDEYRYDDLTGLEFEEGDVATQIVLYVNGRSQRIKAPKSQAEKLRHELREAVFDYFDVSSNAALSEIFEDPTAPEDNSSGSEFPFDDAVEPLAMRDPEEDEEAVVTSDDEYIGTPLDESETSADHQQAGGLSDERRREIDAALRELQATIEEQQAVLEAQQSAVDAIIESLQFEQ